jgi:probable phosphoglycerate mutase
MNNEIVKLYFMRHGQTIINKANRVQGWCDGVLTEEGLKIAELTAKGLRDIEFKAVYSSDLGRASKTAKIVINANRASKNIKLKEMSELREMCFGKYEGELEAVFAKDLMTYLKVSSFKEAMEKYPDFGRAFADTCAALDDTGIAENYESLIRRIKSGIDKIIEEVLELGGGNVLIVVHGGMLMNLLNFIDENLDINFIENSSISLVEYENKKYKIISVSDMSYKIAGEKIEAIN